MWIETWVCEIPENLRITAVVTDEIQTIAEARAILRSLVPELRQLSGSQTVDINTIRINSIDQQFSAEQALDVYERDSERRAMHELTTALFNRELCLAQTVESEFLVFRGEFVNWLSEDDSSNWNDDINTSYLAIFGLTPADAINDIATYGIEGFRNRIAQINFEDISE